MLQPIRAAFAPEFFDQFAQAQTLLDAYADGVDKASKKQINLSSGDAVSSVASLVKSQQDLVKITDELTLAIGEYKKMADQKAILDARLAALDSAQAQAVQAAAVAVSEKTRALREAAQAQSQDYQNRIQDRQLNKLIADEEKKMAKERADAVKQANRDKAQADQEYQNLWKKLIKDRETATAQDAKIAKDASNDYGILSKAYQEAALRAKNYSLTLGANSPITIAATAEAKAMGAQLYALDSSVGQYQRNVGNYSSALTGYANTLRSLRGPTKLLGEVLGVGAQAADQLRLVVEHSLQGLAAYFRAKEEKVAAETADTAAMAANTAANTANAASETAAAAGAEGLAVAEGEVAGAATAATGAMSAFSIVVGATVGLVLVAIGYLVYKFIEYREAVKQAALAHDVFSKALDSADYKSAIENTQKLADDVQLAKQGYIDSQPVIEAYNKSIGEAAGQVTTLSEVEQGLIDHKDAYVQMMLYKAAAAEAYKEAAEKSVKAQQSLSDVGTAPDTKDYFIPGPLGIMPQLDADVRRQDESEKAQKQSDRLVAIARDFNAKMAQVAKENHLDSGLNGNIQPGSVADLRQQISLLESKIDTEKRGSAQQLADTRQLIALKKELKDIDGTARTSHAHDTTNEELKAETDYTKALFDQFKQRSSNNAKEQKAIADDETNNLQKRSDAHQNYTNELLNEAGLESAKEQTVIQQKLDKIAEIENKAANQRTPQEKALLLEKKALEVEEVTATEKYEGLKTDIVEQNAKWQLGLIKQYGKEGEDAIKQSVKNLEGLSKAFAGSGGSESLQQHLEAQRRQLQEVQTYAQAALDLAAIEKNASDARIAGIQKEIDAIEKKKQADIDAVNASLLSQTDKDNKIAEINARAQADEDARNEKIKQEKRHQAELDKAIGIAKILINTAVGVTAQLEAGPAGLGLAIAAGVLGAAELAVAIATPIPEFAVGTDDAPEGIAKVHKGELYIPKDGSTPHYIASDTLAYLKKGDVVKTASETAEIFKYFGAGIPRLEAGRPDRNAELLNELQESREVLKAIRDKRFPTQRIPPAWYQDYYTNRNK